MVMDDVRPSAEMTNETIAALFRELDAAEAEVRRVREELRAANLDYMLRKGFRGLSLDALRREVTR